MIEFKSSRKFREKVRNFPEEIYRINDPTTHIYKMMYAALQIGLGPLSTWQDEADNSESLAGTKFNDLDAMFNFLGMTRLPEELYGYDPYLDQLTSDQWNEIVTKDSLFRLRILRFFQALLRGGTLEGIAMAAQAASGVECQVFEMWRVISGLGLGASVSLGRTPALNLAKEFVVIPLEDINDSQRIAIIHLVEILKPVNTICTVHDSPSIPLTEVVIRWAASESHFFEVRKMVSATDDLLFQGKEIWIQPNAEVEGPTFAGMATSDTEWSLNEAVTSIKTFRADDEYLVPFATVATSNIMAGDVSIIVDETADPAAPSFNIKIDNEILFVTERSPVVGEDTKYTYAVLRAQEGTIAAGHTVGANVNSGVLQFYADVTGITSAYGPWRVIPLADSSDNFPSGQFPGDPSKYDEEGNYTFDYVSQSAYVEWFTNSIQTIGGQVNSGQYRLPLSIDAVGGLVSSPEDALAAPEFVIQSRIYPGRAR